MKRLSILLVLLAASPVLGQDKRKPAYIQQRELLKQRTSEYRKADLAKAAEATRWQREYESFAKTGQLPPDPDRAKVVLQMHETRLKNIETQAKVAALQPKGKWVWVQDPVTGRMVDKWMAQDDLDRIEKDMNKGPKTVTGTHTRNWDGSVNSTYTFPR